MADHLTPRLYTVGHSTRSPEELIEVLRSADIELVVDVRRFPGSRRNPHFAREAMEVWLPETSFTYDWRGEELGGRRHGAPAGRSRHIGWRNSGFQAYADHMDSHEFQTALEQLMQDCSNAAVAVMCAETLWWNCHRRLISDAAVALHDCEVIHLTNAKQHQPHKLHPEARVDEQGRLTYDLNVDRELPL